MELIPALAETPVLEGDSNGVLLRRRNACGHRPCDYRQRGGDGYKVVIIAVLHLKDLHE
jgi:hypothetical protein